MATGAQERERVAAELRAFVQELQGRIASGSLDAAQMILGCRRVLDLWTATGGSSLDDEVVGFLAIESQTSHVLGGPDVPTGRDGDGPRFEPGSVEESAEVDDCGRWFLDGFKRDVADLSTILNVRLGPEPDVDNLTRRRC